MSGDRRTSAAIAMRIGGREVRTGRTERIVSPFDGALVGEVSLAGIGEVEAAIGTGLAALDPARALPRHERRRILRETARRLEAERDEIARTLALEAGKPIAQARGEVARGIVTFDLAADEAIRGGGEVIPIDLEPRANGFVASVHRTPIGLVAGISPFNFPLNLVAHKVAPAIAAGAPIVLKPARKTPLTALRLAGIIEETGAPPGLVTVLPCDREVGDRLVTDERFRLLTFTGSPSVGWEMKARAGKKKVVLELGGNAAAIVEPDADLDWAVERSVLGGFSYAGQSCISLQRLYVAESIYEPFREKLIARVSRLRVGDPLDDRTDVGPVIDEGSAERIVAWLEEARGRGARLLAGGKRKGTMVEPAIVEDPPSDASVSCEEVFGPVVTIGRYAGLEQALAAANDSRFGLQAALFTHDVRSIHRALETLEVGALIVNEAPTFRVDNYPYGGVKDSGLGREGVRYAVEEMTEPRVLVVNTRR